MSPPTDEKGAPAQGAPPKQPTASRSAKTNGTEPPGYKLLLDRLEGVRRLRNFTHPAWQVRCPMPNHPDENPSVLIEYKVGRYKQPDLFVWCRTCRVSLTKICEAVGVEVHRVLNGNACLNREIGQRQTQPALLPTPAEIEKWGERFCGDKAKLAYLRDKRGLNFDTAIRFRIGHDGDRYTLPVYESGRLVNLRRYLPGAEVGKMKGLAGRTSKNLYPDVPEGPWVLLCEGEWDTLVARQHGLPAVTSTAGMDGWDEAWNERFRGRQVAIAFDCHDKAQQAAVRRAGEMVRVARMVKVVNLGLLDKEDVTDWFVKYQRTAADLRQLIKDTPAWK